MRILSSHKYIFAAVSVFFALGVLQARAATLSLSPESRNFGIGQEFSVDLKVDTKEASVNAAQAVIRFPIAILQMIGVDKKDSAFSFWLEEPTVSNGDGTMRFIGGTTKGVSGGALQILRMKFRTMGAGTAEITIADAAVTASDGKGTNVLSEVQGTKIVVGATVVVPSPVPAVPENAERPEKVVRTAAPAQGTPGKPKLRVPLYPDESRWYNQLGEVIVFWELPPDVTQVAARLSHSPEVKTSDQQKELFTGKSFGTLMEEGVWYIGVRFRNNVGWGEPTYYKIAIDRTAPLPFEVVIDNEISDNPSPEIRFETQDSLSGVAEYLITIDGGDALRTSSSGLTLTPQAPGKHDVRVQALDFAGNSVEDGLGFEIVPLPTPTIDFVTPTVPQGEFIFASGKAVPATSLKARLVNDKGQEVFTGAVTSDEAGNWKITIDQPLATGTYTLRVQSSDSRGAVSNETEARKVRIKAKTVFSIGGIDLGWLEISVIIVLLVISTVSVGAWYSLAAKRKRGAYATIAARDIEKLTTLFGNDLTTLENLEKAQTTVDPRVKTEREALMQKMGDTVAKMKKYLSQEVEKLK